MVTAMTKMMKHRQPGGSKKEYQKQKQNTDALNCFHHLIEDAKVIQNLTRMIW